MSHTFNWLAITVASCIFIPLQAQKVLSLEAAIASALQNNHEIEIRRYDTQISAMQVDPAIVGKRPTIELNASYELGWSDANIETLSLGPGGEGNNVIELDGISNEIVVGPSINFVVLDGKAAKYRLAQLSTLSDISQLQLQRTIEQTIANVSFAYVQMAQQQSLLDITRETIALTQYRLDRLKQDAKYGTSSNLQALQVEVDLKTDSAALNQQLLSYANARRNLNQLLGQALNTEFLVEEDVQVNTQLRLPELEGNLKERNRLLKLGDHEMRMAALDVQLNRSAFRPKLQAYANLNYVYLQDEANFLQSNRVIGPNLGVRFSWPLYDGGARRIKLESSTLSQKQRALERQDVEEDMLTELYNTFATYQNTLEQWRIEKSNLPVFQENLSNIQNRFKMGLVTNTDVRSAQLNLNAAHNRINSYQYSLKQTEISLALLTGALVETQQ